MEKEENQNSTSSDRNQGTVKETEKPEEKLAEENKQETDQQSKEEIKEYINKHKKRFEREANTNIKYVYFEEKPSLDDENSAKEELNDIISKLSL